MSPHSDDRRRREQSWLPDELGTAGREHLDPAHAARYDTKEDTQASVEIALLANHGLAEKPTVVVDLGAGTGQFTLEVAKTAEHVVAVDVSPIMLERLQAKLAATPLENVECVNAGFITYNHTGPPAELVYTRYALHHLPDFWKAIALARIARYLKPSGLLRISDVVYGFQPHESEAALERWFASARARSPEDGWTRAELEEHVRDEHSTYTWLLEPMIERAGFTIEHADYSADQIFASYICRRRDNKPR